MGVGVTPTILTKLNGGPEAVELLSSFGPSAFINSSTVPRRAAPARALPPAHTLARAADGLGGHGAIPRASGCCSKSLKSSDWPTVEL